MKWFLIVLLALSISGCRTNLNSTSEPKLERIIVAPDGRSFVLAESRQPFVPWGMNYGNAGRLMEDFWDDDWKTFAADFRELKELGANVIRVHLQFGKFMNSPDEPNPVALKQFKRMLRLAEDTGIYLDVTGLASYRPSDTPAWYDAMDESARWKTQANFWSAIAKAGANSPAIFCYDLINEPVSPGQKREPGTWRSGHLYGGYDFLQNIALDPAGRKREDIAVAWIRQLTAAIREHDQKTLITVGLLPWSRQWKHLSGFLPEKVAPELDFLSVHIYPDSKKPDEAMECLRQFAVGKPIVIEETFPLTCSVPELETFLRDSRAFACGWIGHYDGKTLAELDALKEAGNITLSQSIYRSWLELFVRLEPEFVSDAVLPSSITAAQSTTDSPLITTPNPNVGVGAKPIPGAEIILDGSRTMLDEKWTYWEGPRFSSSLPIKWKIVEDPVDKGTVVQTDDPAAAGGKFGSADIVTKKAYRDFRLHIEFLVNNEGGNSGVYLQNRYEIQIKDGDKTKHGMGAVINESESPYHAYNGLGKWNAYDINFRAARFEEGKLVEKAKVTMYFNGIKVHTNQVIHQVWGGPNSGIDGGNDGGKGITDTPGGLKLQCEGHDVRYRNAWIQEIELEKADTDF